MPLSFQRTRIVPFPCGLRSTACGEDRLIFEDICKADRLDPLCYDILYVRPFNDGRNKYRAYAVARKDDPKRGSLLFVEL